MNLINSILIKYFPLAFASSFILVIGLILTDQFSMRQNLLVSTALENAKIYIQTLETFRNVYSKEVVANAKTVGVTVSHNYQEIPGAIPLPATFAMKLGQEIGFGSSGAKVKLYSEYPFPWRKKGGPQSQFEQNAIEHFRSQPKQAYYEFADIDGVYTLNYARADIMLNNCISCHNTHPQTPKSDWKVGDVRGVLSVSLPISSGNFEKENFFMEKIVLISILGVIGLLWGLAFIRRLKITSIDND